VVLRPHFLGIKIARALGALQGFRRHGSLSEKRGEI
jgi:hypothetical protein